VTGLTAGLPHLEAGAGLGGDVEDLLPGRLLHELHLDEAVDEAHGTKPRPCGGSAGAATNTRLPENTRERGERHDASPNGTLSKSVVNGA